MGKKTFISLAAVAVLIGIGSVMPEPEPQPAKEKQPDPEWPFTVDRVRVGCDAMGFPYADAGRHGTFGLTGHAVNRGYPPVSHIHIEGKSLSPFIEEALSKCPTRPTRRF